MSFPLSSFLANSQSPPSLVEDMPSIRVNAFSVSSPSTPEASSSTSNPNGEANWNESASSEKLEAEETFSEESESLHCPICKEVILEQDVEAHYQWELDRLDERIASETGNTAILSKRLFVSEYLIVKISTETKCYPTEENSTCQK